jgi:nitric oxide reductase NorD protein
MLPPIRRQFELLRGARSRLRKQLDGDEIDLEAYLESRSDFGAGLPLAQRLYQTQRRAYRDLAIVLLVDVSGSTDSWVAAQRRVIDVEREALLLVCMALDGLMQPYAVQAFSGNGSERVTIRTVKGFDERFDSGVAQRISSLEPEEYTRAGTEDFRQSVTEAKLQGISPFCLTIDRQAASYLPFVFGAGHYALLTRPELLPMALLDWVRRLLAA